MHQEDRGQQGLGGQCRGEGGNNKIHGNGGTNISASHRASCTKSRLIADYSLYSAALAPSIPEAHPW